MAESTLALKYSAIRSEVGRAMGFGRTIPEGDLGDDVDAAIERGLRQFYSPPALPNEQHAHIWSFMRPIKSLTTEAPYTTGTVAVTSSTVTLAGNGAVWPTWAADGHITITGTGDLCNTILTRDSATQLTLDSAVTTDVSAGATYTLHHNAAYTMDDDFGGIDGSVTFARCESQTRLWSTRIPVVDESMIRARWNADPNYTQSPRMCAVRPISTVPSGTSTGQRFELVFWPEPDVAYDLEFRYFVIADKISTTNEYPLGGSLHGETILASCLSAAAEYHMTMDARFRQEYYGRFMERLRASIYLDRQANASETLGYNYDRSDGVELSGGRIRLRIQDVTYNGTLY